MDGIWSLAMPGRKESGYIREKNRTDTIFTFLRYKDVTVNFAKKEGTKTRVEDRYSGLLQQLGLITEQQQKQCQQAVCDEYYHKDCHGEQAPEDVYAFTQKARLQTYGLDVLKKARGILKDRSCDFDPREGIDQRREKENLLKKSNQILFLLCDVRLYRVMEADVQAVRAMGKTAVIGYSPTGEGDLPTREELADWLGNDLSYTPAAPEGIGTDPEGACLLFYGEEGLLHCRGLTVDTVVHAIPNGYHAQALCNCLGQEKPCVVYIPRGLDITPYVPLTSPTQLSFYHLAKLCRDHGKGIYELSCQALYEKYPGYFVNIYDSSDATLPVTVQGGYADFVQNREAAVAEFLNGFSNIRYQRAYFEKEKILVHALRVTKARGAQVISCPKGVTPRQQLKGQTGTALVSNFLFFLTPKLGTLYNDLRADRPYEQADAAAGHLDYKLEYREGKRIETFPLFQKACIGCLRSGEFIFFPFRLGGGQVTVENTTIRWEKEWVDPQTPGDICMYTPMYTNTDADADRETYRKTVGAGRVNLVILQDRVTCIRRGDVILPSVGVVLSLSEAAAEPILKACEPLENGYFKAQLPLTVRLDPPASVPFETWEQLAWAYGGGLSLISDGEGLCDGEDMLPRLSRDGWMTPLSRQTQESALHKLAKHPRTAIGTAKNGELVILVYSGRTRYSTGADYREMIEIARAMHPDIDQLMNVDGGGSAVLGLSHEGSFMELSVPATSQGSCVGMVRPISTLFYIPAEKEN